MQHDFEHGPAEDLLDDLSGIEKLEIEEVEEAKEADEWDLLSDGHVLSPSKNLNNENNDDNSDNNDEIVVIGNNGESIKSDEMTGKDDNRSNDLSMISPRSEHQLLLSRTPSSSTIDSDAGDSCLGPSGKGILGVDYVEHIVSPTDTLQGICLAYRIPASKLRQANHFSGASLFLAPKKLVIPISTKALNTGYLRVQDTDSKEYKIHAFQTEFSNLSFAEAKAYLELTNWVLKDAMQSAREDMKSGKREAEEAKDATNENSTKDNNLKSGEIRITMQPGGQTRKGYWGKSNPFSFEMRGAGIKESSEKQFNKSSIK